MSLELIYTSVARGLSPGSSGFCTAAATGGMSRQVVTRLEALSGYQFHFNLSDPRAAENPANYAHTQVRIGAETLSVLSRIAFSGADYSGRTNKIAHHFLLEHGEQSPNGPAWMMMEMARQTFVAGYSGEPRNLPKRDLQTLLATGPQPPEPATNWQSQTGDAGWAGMLVKAFRENPKVPAFVIFAPGQELLPLFEESLALLPPEERWEVGFATYYTALPAGCQYHWRGIIAGSSAAKEIQRFPNATVLDLTMALGQATDNIFTQAARTGTVLPPVRAPERPKIQIVERVPEPVPLAAGVAKEDDDLAFAMEAGQYGPRVDLRDVAPSSAQLRSLIRRARRARWVPLLFAAVILLAVSTLVSTGLYFHNLWRSTPQAETATAATTPAPPAQAAAPAHDKAQVPPPKPLPEEAPAKPTAPSELDTAPAKPSKPTTPASPPEQGGKGVETQPQTAQADKPGSKPEVVEPPKEGAGAEAAAKPPGEPGVKGQSPPKAAPPPIKKPFMVESRLRSKSEVFGDAQPTKTEEVAFSGGPQDNKRTAPLVDSDSFTFLKIPEKFAKADPPLFCLAMAEGTGGSRTLEAKVPSGGIRGDKTLATFRVEAGRNGAVLECEIDRAQAEYNPGVYNWMVIEVADEQKALHKYHFGPQRRQPEQRTLGYSNNGPLKTEALRFKYPWPDMLMLSVKGKEERALMPSDRVNLLYDFEVQGGQECGEKKQVRLTVTVSAQTPSGKPPELQILLGLSTLDEINTVAKTVAPEWAEYEKNRKLAEGIQTKAKDTKAKDRPNDEQQRAAEKFLKDEPPDRIVKARQTIEAFYDAAETVLKMHGLIRVVDPWDLPVMQVDLRFQRCKPDDLFKHFAPKDDKKK